MGARHAPADWIEPARIVALSWDGLGVAAIAARVPVPGLRTGLRALPVRLLASPGGQRRQRQYRSLPCEARAGAGSPPAVRDVVTTGRRLAYLNRSAHYGRSGLIVSGPARTGKTTAITQLGKTIEVFHRRRYPRSGDDIPVVYITVPPAATPKMIASEFARFLGLPVTRRANITDIIEAICGVCTDTKTSVICAPCDSQWATLIAALETSLRLHQHQPGSLPELARYLHQRTGEMIGSLL